MPDPPTTGPAELDPMAYLTDGQAELDRCAAQHWWARGMDQHGQPMPLVLGWEANRETLSDRRLSPRSFVDDMIAGGLSAATAAQVAPLFSRHGADHRHLRAVLSTAFTPRKVEQLRPAARSIAERLADGIEENGGACEFVAAFAEPLPPEVFAILFGLPVEDRDRMGGGRRRSPAPSRCRWHRRTSRWSSPPPPRCGPTGTSASLPAGHPRRRPRDPARRGRGRRPAAVRRRRDRHDHRLRVRRRRDHPAPAHRGGRVAGRAPDSWERLAADPALLPTAVDEILRPHRVGAHPASRGAVRAGGPGRRARGVAFCCPSSPPTGTRPGSSGPTTSRSTAPRPTPT